MTQSTLVRKYFTQITEGTNSQDIPHRIDIYLYWQKKKGY
jgi:hypothetical protein